MNIVVTGASGFIGSALVPHLTRAGHQVVPLRIRGELNVALEGPLDCAILLGGENIAQGWTAAATKRIRDSRVRGTESISRALANREPRPRVLLCASGIGFYGNRDDEVLTEDSKAGEGFLAEVCQDWEAACEPAAKAGIRVVNLRFGVVLDPSGGALKKMLPAFRAGFGGRVGSGKQYWSWVTRDDVLRVIDHALTNETLRGPINVVAPNPVCNSDFTKALARALRRPAILPVPAFALRLLLGEMADEALLASTRAVPQRLQQNGFKFVDGELEPALRRMFDHR
jgi:uncharacterized protein (TIGR01777 family)